MKRGSNVDPIDDDPEITGLEIFEGELAGEITWYFYRVPEAGEREGERHGYCWKQFGEIDPETLQRELGGGLYRVIGRNGRTLVKSARIRLAGPPRVQPASTAAPAPDALTSRLDRLEALLEKQARPASSVDQLSGLVQLAQLMSGLRPDPVALVAPMLSMFERGANLAGARDGTDTAGIIREAVNGIATIMDRRVPAAPAGQATADPLEDLVRVLVRVQTEGRTAADAADALESILSEVNLARLRGIPEASVVTAVRPRLVGLDPAAAAAFEQFLLQTLVQLKKPADDNDNAGEL